MLFFTISVSMINKKQHFGRILYCWFTIFAVLTTVEAASTLNTNLFIFTNRPVVQPFKTADFARFELIPLTSRLELTNCRVLYGSGKFVNTTKEISTNKIPVYEITFPINHYSWTETAIMFLPNASGSISIRLSGPYEKSTNGIVYREDNLWDKIEITGATITNGSFEEVTGNRPIAWVYGGGTVNSAPVKAFDGHYYARTSHDKALEQKFDVKANTPVVVKVRARSFPPFNFKDMKRITEKTPAHSIALAYKRGVNLPGILENPPQNLQNITLLHTDFVFMKSEGFDHIKLPVAWHYYVGGAPDYLLDKKVFDKVETIITNAFLNDLNVIISWGKFDEFYINPSGAAQKFYAIWKQISQFYNLYPTNLAFELLADVPENISTETLNPIYLEAIKIIRFLNPERAVFLCPGKNGSIDELGKFNFPIDEDNVIIGINFYEPLPFTHQGLNAGRYNLSQIKGIMFPGPPQKPIDISKYSALDDQLKQWIMNYNQLPLEINPCGITAARAKVGVAKQWSDYYGRPVYIRAFGATVNADELSRAEYYEEMRKMFDEFGIGWAIDGWNTGFKYWDSARNQPLNGLRKALFSKQ